MDMLCDIDADKSALVCSCVLVSGGMLRFIFLVQLMLPAVG